MANLNAELLTGLQSAATAISEGVGKLVEVSGSLDAKEAVVAQVKESLKKAETERNSVDSNLSEVFSSLKDAVSKLNETLGSLS